MESELFEYFYMHFLDFAGLKGTKGRPQASERKVTVKQDNGVEENKINVDHSSPKVIAHTEENTDGLDITLDQPFFWSFQDDMLGPVALGAVLVPQQRLESIPNNYMEPFLECN